MEGSGSGPANFGQLDPSVVNGSGAGPMAAVPLGGGPGGPGGAGGGIPQAMPTPGPAATAMPQAQRPVAPPPPPPMHNPMPPGVAELNAPGESVLLTEMQELKSAAQNAIKLNRIYALLLLGAGMAMIYYIGSSVKAKVGIE